MRFIRRLVRCLTIFLVCGLLWGGWYIYNKGFSRKWRHYVSSEFRKHGVEISIRRLTLDPFHGLLAKEVKIVDEKDRHKTLAVISQILLDINYADLFQGRPFLNAIDLRNANLMLPIDPSNSQSTKFEISKLNARVLLPPHQFYLSHAEAEIYGIHFSVSGRVINPEGFQASLKRFKTNKKSTGNSIETLLTGLRNLQFEGAPPRVDIRFSGDLADLDKIFVEAVFAGTKTSYNGYRLENFSLQASYRDGLLNLMQCLVNDSQGVLNATGNYRFLTGEASFQLKSTLNIQRLTRALKVTQWPDEFVFYSMPTIELSGNAFLKDTPKVKVIGHLSLDKFFLRSVIFQGLDVDFSWDGKQWYIRDFRLVNRTGEMVADAIQLPGNFRLRLRSTINPNGLMPLTSGKLAEFLSEWDFQQSPEVELTAHGPSLDFALCEATGQIRLGETRYRGVPLKSAHSKLHIKNKAVTYENFKIDREEGIGTGTFTYDFGKHEVRLDKIKTTLNVREVATWIHPDVVKDVTPYRFKLQPALSLNGVVQFDGGKNTNLEILVDAPEGMDYVFLKKNLSIPKLSGRLLFTDRHLKISDVAATLYSGQIRGNADISLSRTSPGYKAMINVKDVDFASLTKLYFNYENSKGLLNGAYKFEGDNSDPRTMRGQGEVNVINGNVFAIPMLGPFSAILNDIVPGMGYSVAQKASSRFNINDGIISTRDFLVKGKGFSMLGNGNLYFVDDKIDFNIRINAQGIPGVLLFPVSKLFEYVSEGSLSKPTWHPKHLPHVK